jgi:8-hydroxy-5-deazaflavin:NADPH oxidoreductase
MKIAVVGAGRVGMALARRFLPKHDLLIGSRDGARAEALAREIGAAGSGSYQEVADAADVVILGVPWWGIEETLAEVGELNGKVVIDAVNPFTDDSYTEMVEFVGTSAAEEIQKAKPKARVVKGWNTVHEQVINSESGSNFNGVVANVFLCGEDPAARQIVAELAREIGYAPVDCGPLSSARFLEAISGLKVRLSYDLEMGTEQAINLIER